MGQPLLKPLEPTPVENISEPAPEMTVNIQSEPLIVEKPIRIFHTHLEDMSHYEPAPFTTRALAFTLDMIFFMLLYRAIAVLLQGLYQYLESTSLPLLIVTYGLTTVLLVGYYYAWPMSEFGCSFGKKLLGLKVLNIDTRKEIGFFQALGRETIGKLISTILFLTGFLLPALRADRRALHDLLFQTAVMKNRNRQS